MKMPKFRLSKENQEAFEKRLMFWKIMRDMFGGWSGLADYLECWKYVKKGPKRIMKKRIKIYLIRTMFLDLHQETGLTWSRDG